MLPHRRFVELDVHHLFGGQSVADLRPYFFRRAVQVRVANRSFELTQHLLGRHRFGAVNADVTKEPDLILRAMNVQPPRIVAAQLWGVYDPGKNPNPKQQLSHIVDETPTG